MKELINSYFKDYSLIREISDRCLNTERWRGNVLLMVIDAAFTSVGLNYFQVVVPKVKKFEEDFVKTEKIVCLSDFVNFNLEELFYIWKNKRSWQIVKEISKYLSNISKNDKEALRVWARNSSLSNWRENTIGRIKGVGLVTYQYLRMMGGIDTIMPDKIVKRTMNEILQKVGKKDLNNDIEFINFIEKIAKKTGYRAVELCFMTWFRNNPEKIKDMP
ncbi:MAG: hypothetical protein NZ845_03650 [Thermodesulfovibrio sp.]|nr:hypothetical protein [Thermodesulfovibrio sp.]